MPDLPKVSICIPSYNHARYLPAAIESALAQTYPNIEIVIVDDGSTDGSLEIAESYAVQHPSLVAVFTHVNHRNLGIAATVNLCFKRSTGAYLGLLGSDDMLYPRKTSIQAAYLNQHSDIGWVYSYAQFVDEHGTLLRQTLGEDISRDPDSTEKLIAANRIPDMTALVRRDCLEQIGGHTEGLLYSDWEFWVRMCARYQAGFIKKHLVKYRTHDCNTSLGIEDEQNLKRALEVMNSLRRNASHYGGELTTPRTQALIDLQRARYLFCLDQSDAAAESLSSVFEIYPAIQDEPRLFLRWLTDAYLAHVKAPAFYSWLIDQLPTGIKMSFRRQLSEALRGRTLARAAAESYRAGDFQKARKMAVRAQAAHPSLLRDRQLMSILIKTLAGSRVMNKVRQLKHRTRTAEGQ